MLDKLPDAIPDDKYWTLGQLVNRRDNICTHLHRLKNQFFTGEEPEAGKLGAGVSQALAERLFSEEILGGLAEGLGIPEETVTAQEETGTDSSDTANADYGQTMTATPGNAAPGAVSPGNAAASYAGKNDNGNNGNGGNGNHYGWGNGNNGNGNGNNGNGNGNSSTGGTNDNNGNANGNTNNTGGSQNQSGILFPAEGEVSELEQELIDMIKTTGKQKNYELVEYVNDVNRDHVEVLMELNINGIMDTAYSYGNERLTNERFTGWTGYYTYDPRGSVTGVTGSDGYIWQSYRYNAFGDITFGKPQYNNVYSYNAESFNPNMDAQYLRARYYSVKTAGFISEDSYLGDITDPLTLNRYNYVKSSPLNYTDPSGNVVETVIDVVSAIDSSVRFMNDPSWANAGFAVWDIGAAIIPLAPGSYVVKGAKYLGEFDNAVQAGKALSLLNEAGYLKDKMLVAEFDSKISRCDVGKEILV